MQARVMRITASVGLRMAASGTFSMRTSCALYMIAARMFHFLFGSDCRLRPACRSRSQRQQLDRGGPRLGGYHRVQPLRAVPQIFAAIGGVDPVMGGGIGVLEPDVFLDA